MSNQNQMSQLAVLVRAAVAARGYEKGYTPEAMVARQVFKLLEELGELVKHIGTDKPMFAQTLLELAGEAGKAAFDGLPTEDWNACDLDWAGVVDELTDVAIVVLTAIAVVEDEAGVDMVKKILTKVSADRGRGVRGEG
jgi:NTP pyrophosphatase (non-canonical NTP hydrolase)